MRIIGADHILKAVNSLDSGSAGQLVAWMAEVHCAEWSKMAEVQEAYPSGSWSGGWFEFLLVGKSVRVTALITFDVPTVMVTGLTLLQAASEPHRRRS